MKKKIGFASHDLTAGQLNAIVKKLGGKEGAMKFLRDEVVVQPPPPPIPWVPPPLPATLAEFVASELYASVIERLKAAKTYILIAESEAFMSQSVSVSLDGEGFAASVQVVGMAAAYTSQKPSLRRLTVEEAVQDIRECGEYEISETEIAKRIVDGALQVPDMTM